jgi:hypothetical protein
MSDNLFQFTADDTKPENTKKLNTRVFEFSRYNIPQFLEVANKQYILWGKDNNYPYFLMDCLQKSSTHKAICDFKIENITGDGWQIEDSEDHAQESLITAFLKKPNKYETADEILYKISYDWTVANAFALNLIWSKDRTKIAAIHHVDISSVRSGKMDDEGNICDYWICDDWRKSASNKEKYKPYRIASFSKTDRIEPSQLLFVKKYDMAKSYYPIPSYIAALNDIQSEYKISNFILSTLTNQLTPSCIINFNQGNCTPEEKDMIFRSLIAMYKGDDNAGKAIVSFNDSKDNAATVTPFSNNDLPQTLTQIQESIVARIMTAHKVTSTELLGISTPGKMGSSDDLSRASELFFNQVVAPAQSVIEKVFNQILEINRFTLHVSIKDIQPISFQYSEDTLLQIMTQDELRKRIGLPPLSKTDTPVVVNDKGTPPAEETKPKAGAKKEVVQEAAAPVNENIKNLTARQHQQVFRIIRQFGQKKITRQQAVVMLRSGYGLSDSDINELLATNMVNMMSDKLFDNE